MVAVTVEMMGSSLSTGILDQRLIDNDRIAARGGRMKRHGTKKEEAVEKRREQGPGVWKLGKG